MPPANGAARAGQTARDPPLKHVRPSALVWPSTGGDRRWARFIPAFQDRQHKTGAVRIRGIKNWACQYSRTAARRPQGAAGIVQHTCRAALLYEGKEFAMKNETKDEIKFDHNGDGIDRRGFLKCMAWAGTGTLCVMKGGVLNSYALSALTTEDAAKANGALSFAQISDSHMGFNKPANTDVVATLKAAVDKLNALPTPPEFLLHTGDISHLSRPEEFDTVDQILKSAVAKDVFFVPGEHDVIGDDGKQYLERYAKNSQGAGWYSFDKKGVHFVGLVNVMNLKAGGLGSLGADQLAWIERDLKPLSSSVPIIVFAHIPLWSV